MPGTVSGVIADAWQYDIYPRWRTLDWLEGQRKNLKLKTLAEHRINGALLDYLRHIDPLPRDVRRFQKQRDADRRIIGHWRSPPALQRFAHALGVSLQKYVTLSRMIAAAEPISIHESTVAAELAGQSRSMFPTSIWHGECKHWEALKPLPSFG